MSRVTIKDKTFETSIPEAEILERVKQVADRINKDFEGKTPLFLAVLNGSFMYASDLMKHITIHVRFPLLSWLLTKVSPQRVLSRRLLV